MTQSLTSLTVPLSDLTIHPANVRANAPDPTDEDQTQHLKASIATLGLMNPLLVQKVDGKYAVLAGRRRHAALMLLAADKSAKGFTRKMQVDCRAVPDDCDVTTALSLAENITQAAMSPIDEFEAFARMMEVDDLTPDQIAMIFGTTVAAVKERLRYGRVHPDIRAAVRARDITIDTMKAFADHPGQDVQLEVYDALRANGGHLQAYTVRQALKSRGVKVSDALGAFVREDYEARGGTIAADLLDEHSVLENRELIEQILSAKLQAAAQARQAELGMAWADTVISWDHAAMSDYGRIYPGPIEPDEAALERIAQIETRVEELSRDLADEDLDDDGYTTLTDEYDALEEEARNLQEAYAQDDLARAGVIASWGHNGVTLHIGLVRPEDKPAARDEPGAREAGTTTADDSIVYSGSLADDLKTERAMAVGAALALNPEVTMDLALFKLVTDVLNTMTATYAIKVSASKEYRTHSKMDEIDSLSLDQTGQALDALDLSWADDQRSEADQFALFRVLPALEKAKLVAFATGATTQPCLARDPAQDSLMHAIEAEIMPDIRAHWTPNAAFFGRLKKAQLLKVLADDLGLAQEAVALASSSKKEIVAFCDKLFAEPFATLTEDQLQAVASWAPPYMQTDLPSGPDDAGQADPTDQAEAA